MMSDVVLIILIFLMLLEKYIFTKYPCRIHSLALIL